MRTIRPGLLPLFGQFQAAVWYFPDHGRRQQRESPQSLTGPERDSAMIFPLLPLASPRSDGYRRM
jgi:hypothetical protein